MPTRASRGRPFSGKPSLQRTEVWSTSSPLHVPDPKPNGWISGGDSQPKTKVYLPVVQLTRSGRPGQPLVSKGPFERLYPDCTEKSRCQQLFRRWESLPGLRSLRSPLKPEELDALAEQVRSLSPSERRLSRSAGTLAPRADESPKKDFPFIPCSCCERESPIAKMKRDAGIAARDSFCCEAP
ncbi:unnamed protein product [Cladocopium goreaui]|uniref:Methyltransferase FkbM domain-containing protein n=1 Tax=Cladocopium goreaui TaxID=2562237 RepID=A0A9P1M653_9DINO|nr:unnamed protein product [Cladocopium goreaui]|mmetsp:Transcript_4860/g.11150  ORF Transcript_4860/g.11150 Transcript_4860/m.11150 type:complete len:183 (+) Transcript_4860:83-631(+)